MKKVYLNEIAKEFNLKEHVIRFYDSKGLTPFIKRDENNYRYIDEQDKGWFRIINCLRETGLPLKEIRYYISLANQGASTVSKRYEIIQKQKSAVIDQINSLEKQLDFLKAKEEHYIRLLKKN